MLSLFPRYAHNNPFPPLQHLLTTKQQHPARDLQDTFYISDPKTAGRPGPVNADDKQNYDEYFENVKQVHQDGKYGSIGYRYPWAEEESLKYVPLKHHASYHPPS